MSKFARLKNLRAKTQELKEKRSNLVNEVKVAAEAGNEDEARSKKLEAEGIEARMEVYEEEITSLLDEIEEDRSKIPNEGRGLTGEKKDEIRKLQIAAMGNVIRGKELTEEQRAVMSSTNNGAVIPEEFVNYFEKLKEGYPSIKEHCHKIPVARNAGKMPVRVGANVNKLANLEEDKELVKAMMTTKPMPYDINDYGLLAPIDNSLLEDSEINFLEYVNEEFGELAVNTENSEIIAILKEVLEKETVTDYKGIVQAMNELSPNARTRAIIVTNNLGRGYLDGLMDKQGRPLLKELSDGGELTFKGRPVIEMDEELLNTEEKIQLFIADCHTLVKFFDRKQYLIDQSKEAGYIKNQTMARIIERFDVETPLDKTDDAAKIRKFGVLVEVNEA